MALVPIAYTLRSLRARWTATALTVLGIAATVGDGDYDDGGNSLLGDQVIENGLHPEPGAVVDDHERCLGAFLVLSGNVNSDLALVVDVVRLDDQRLRVVRIDLPELLAGNARIEELGFLRVDHELLDLPLGNAVDLFAFQRGHVRRPDDEIVMGVERGVLTLFQHLEGRGLRVIELAHRWCGRRTGECNDGD